MSGLPSAERLRRWFGWSFVLLSTVLLFLVAWAFTFTKGTSARVMDTAVICAAAVLLGCVATLIGFVATAITARRRRAAGDDAAPGRY